MLNSVLIEGTVLSIPERNESESVVFKVRHNKALVFNATATGILGLDCRRYLKKGMKVRLVGKLCTEGLLVSYMEFNCRGIA